MRRKLLLIYGPTAVGKTSLAIRLARQYRGELISADSRQVYQGMDIGTGKDILPKARFYRSSRVITARFNLGYYRIERVPIWLLDLITPVQRFNTYTWSDLAKKVCRFLWQRRKLPIVIGGSAFYIKTLLDGIDAAGVKKDEKLRLKLAVCSVKELQKKLKNFWPERLVKMNNSDRRNPRRLIRAIEIGVSQKERENGLKKKDDFWRDVSLCALFLKAPLSSLEKKIKIRIRDRMAMGLLTEIKNLVQQYGWDAPGLESIAYREFQPFLENKKTLDQVLVEWFRDERNYAKSQLSWFRQDCRFAVINKDCRDWKKNVNKTVAKWYDEKNGQEKTAADNN